MNAFVRKSLLALMMAGLVSVPAMAAQEPPPVSTMPVNPPQKLHAIDEAGFGTFVDRVRETFDVPGIAVAVVKDGKVVLAEGYGKRNLESGAPVTADTLFAIASNTKAFTAASLSILADRGKLDMGGRVIRYLPWFRMSDPYVTQAMRVRDLLPITAA